MSKKRLELRDGMEISIFCPKCEVARVKLVVRTNRQNDSRFLACSNWPGCGHTQGLPEDLLQRLRGAIPLPGFFFETYSTK
jgi:ssDNA-binding Zn-finger/Zn-ribbon topoisomerase 1